MPDGFETEEIHVRVERLDSEVPAIHDFVCGELGMRTFDMDASGPLSREPLAELFRTGQRWNYFARV